ncbi:MAG: hypothetical protein II578_02995, partial [Bacteroidaceae bacterium]|nr:hypothetical protein [Bacteroidaceae bacterium]
ACWYPGPLPTEYHLYRVCADITGADVADSHASRLRYDNLCLWRRQVGGNMLLREIEDVVYGMSWRDMRKAANGDLYLGQNHFLRRILTRDREAVRFLAMATECEHVRAETQSPWYYPTMPIEGRTLESLADTLLARATGRYARRYVLQAVRALFTTRRYAEVDSLWRTEVSRWPVDDVMRRHIEQYAVGARVRLGREADAVAFYARTGDTESLRYCLAKHQKVTDMDIIDTLYKYNPNGWGLRRQLQRLLHSVEASHEESVLPEVRDFCQRAAGDGRTKCDALWPYTLAFIFDYLGREDEALHWLQQAEQRHADQTLDESIRLMRMYLDAKTAQMDDRYEQRLEKQLRWLDRLIVRDLTPQVRNRASTLRDASCGISFYYWNDMLRRILLGTVCPRMVSAGRTTRALSLANMTENRLLQLVDTVETYDGERMALSKYRRTHADSCYNALDWQSWFFLMADTLGADAVADYARRVRTPRNDFDRFLNARSYTSKDYLCDLVGTQLLRSMRYAEAVEWLGRVSPAFQRTLNVAQYMYGEPFHAEGRRWETKRYSKFDFAVRMATLEAAVKKTPDPNLRAQMMLQMSRGIRNSFGRCWPLTQYFYGQPGCFHPFDELKYDAAGAFARANAPYKQKALCRAGNLQRTAMQLFTDRECLAQAELEMCNFKTVVEQYAETEAASFVRRNCDTWADYHVK